nr:MAG TPA: hypothetical protein [Caudoviricetes sp.]
MQRVSSVQLVARVSSKRPTPKGANTVALVLPTVPIPVMRLN